MLFNTRPPPLGSGAQGGGRQACLPDCFLACLGQGDQSLPGCRRGLVEVWLEVRHALVSVRCVNSVCCEQTCCCVVNMVTGGGTVSPTGVAGPGVIASGVTGCVTTATPTPGADNAGLPQQRRTSENRRVSLVIRQKDVSNADGVYLTVVLQ